MISAFNILPNLKFHLSWGIPCLTGSVSPIQLYDTQVLKCWTCSKSVLWKSRVPLRLSSMQKISVRKYLLFTLKSICCVKPCVPSKAPKGCWRSAKWSSWLDCDKISKRFALTGFLNKWWRSSRITSLGAEEKGKTWWVRLLPVMTLPTRNKTYFNENGLFS